MSEMPNDPMRDLVEDYALGLLDDAQRVSFETRLAGDADLRRELAATLETLGELGLSAPAALSPALKQRVMARVANTSPARTSTVLPFAAPAPRSRAAYYLGAALAASILLAVRFALDARDARNEADATARSGARAIASRDSLISQLTDPGTESVNLAATGDAKPVIKAYVSRARRIVTLSAGQLETLPAGRAYQLWFIVDGKPVPSATFKSDAAGRALLHEIALPARAVAAAVTVEPEGGSSAPTSPVLFIGKLATE